MMGCSKPRRDMRSGVGNCGGKTSQPEEGIILLGVRTGDTYA